MERIQIYKRQKGLAWFYLIFGLFSIVMGSILLIKTVKTGFNTDFPGGNWNAIIYCLQGIIFCTIGYVIRKNEKYFIEWDTEEFRYLFPNNQLVETIKWSEMKRVTIDTLEINIELAEDQKTVKLDNLQYKEVQIIKQRFEEINKRL
ncbi:hypothetical protein BZG02_07260 [Labilibaculum filiforme]|uniref:Uncharacterized protein n=1 Tax=Labilibaculum filiforme TaxID=1940526 RepID=A0A2N3I0G6_9BACT|nr:hypothetical protein [Labilibaculum filiforme]PKQ63815.1 hypothetical protein BZG02_07260 [Labilibaculum filiforme]